MESQCESGHNCHKTHLTNSEDLYSKGLQSKWRWCWTGVAIEGLFLPRLQYQSQLEMKSASTSSWGCTRRSFFTRPHGSGYRFGNSRAAGVCRFNRQKPCTTSKVISGWTRCCTSWLSWDVIYIYICYPPLPKPMFCIVFGRLFKAALRMCMQVFKAEGRCIFWKLHAGALRMCMQVFKAEGRCMLQFHFHFKFESLWWTKLRMCEDPHVPGNYEPGDDKGQLNEFEYVRESARPRKLWTWWR